MTIKQTRTYTPPAGHTNVVNIADWAETLTGDDKKSCHTGIKFQKSKEKTFVALNKLSISDLGNGKTIYEWDSQESIDACGTNTLYQQYHSRYLEETGITLDITTETI